MSRRPDRQRTALRPRGRIDIEADGAGSDYGYKAGGAVRLGRLGRCGRYCLIYDPRFALLLHQCPARGFALSMVINRWTVGIRRLADDSFAANV